MGGCLQSKESTDPLTLPQHVPEDLQKKRKEALAALREHYLFATDDPTMPPHPPLTIIHIAANANPEEKQTPLMLLKVGGYAGIFVRTLFEQVQINVKEIADEAAVAATHVHDVLEKIAKIEPTPRDHGDQPEAHPLYKIYSTQFKQDFLDKQLLFGGVLTDEAFGARIKSGTAPYQLHRVDAMPDYVSISDADVTGVLPEGDTLASLIAEKRLYKLDFAHLRGVKMWASEMYQKQGWVTNPICLLHLTKDRQLLLPCAIQLFPDPHEAANPVFTPKDPPNLWLAAKMFVINASQNHHTCETHSLSNIAWVGLAMSLRRCLPKEHPIAAFMVPFTRGFLGMAAGNRPLDDDWKLPVMQELWKQWNYNDVVTPKQFKKRGIDDAEAFPAFHYRDDILDLWKVFEKFVRDIVNLTYKTEDDLAKDYELQSFAKELADPAVNGYRGFAFDGDKLPIQRDQLIELLTQVIIQWTARYQADTLAWQWYVWIPFTPLTFKLAPPTSHAELPIDDIINALPKPTSFDATLQKVAIQVIATSQVTFLWNGNAEKPQFSPEVTNYMVGLEGASQAVRDFFGSLAALEDKMKQRLSEPQTNAQNKVVFSLFPSLIQGSQAVI